MRGLRVVERLRHNSIHFSLPVSLEHLGNLVVVSNAARKEELIMAL